MADNTISIDELIAGSQTAFVNQQYEVSKALAKQALAIDYQNDQAHLCLANAEMSFEHYKEAIKHYKKATELKPDAGDNFFYLGYAYASNNETAKALEAFARADERECSESVFGQMYKLMAMACFDLNKPEDAIINFIKAESIIGFDEDMLTRKALCYNMCGNQRAGIEVANQMKLAYPTNYQGYRIAFTILMEQERHEECIEELERAARFADLPMDYYLDWVAYQTARYEIEGKQEYLTTAMEKLRDGMVMVEPEVQNVINAYVNAADLYIRMEKADMALACLQAAENPIASYNNGFYCVEEPDAPLLKTVRITPREFDNMVREIRRAYGDRRIEEIGRNMARNPRMMAPELKGAMTPLAEVEEKPLPQLDHETPASYTPDMMNRLNRLYVSAYTMKKDYDNIKYYAAKLAKSSDVAYKYMGEYTLANALKEQNSPDWPEEYERLTRYFRNEMLKNPGDISVVTYRIQCYIDLGQYGEAERLLNLMAEDARKPLMERIERAKTGGE